jgi:hypothetical protein
MGSLFLLQKAVLRSSSIDILVGSWVNQVVDQGNLSMSVHPASSTYRACQNRLTSIVTTAC